jgi:hypothetical protein
MSIQVAHVTIGLSRGIVVRGANHRRLAGVLTDAVFDWADGQLALTGITWSLWPDTYPGLIVLSPYKLSKGQGDTLAQLIEVRLKQSLLWEGNLSVLYSYRQGEVRLLISDGEYQTDSYGSTTSTRKVGELIPPAHGDMRWNTSQD